jgi:signal transduction histidine kinase
VRDAVIRHTRCVDHAPPAFGRARLTAGTTTAAVLVAIVGSAVGTAVDRGDSYQIGAAVATAFLVVTIAVVGAIVHLTVPDNRVGQLLLVGAVALGVGVGLTEAGIHGVRTVPGSVPGADYMAAVGPALQAAASLLVVVAVPVVFPDGHVPGPRWRWLAWCAAAAIGCLFFGNLLSPQTNEARLAHWHNPLGLPTRHAWIADGLSAVAVLLSVIALAGAVTGLVLRWRRGGRLVRQQLSLFALAACPPAIVLIIIIIANGVPAWVISVAFLPIPVSIAIATLSRGLYDLRRAANRTLVWLTMTVSLGALYVVVVASAAALAPAHRTWWPPVLVVGTAGLLLVPAHRATQRAVNRVVYGRWHEPYEVLAGLGEQLAAAADVDLLLDATVTELTAGLGLEEVSVRGLDGTAIAGTELASGVAVALPAYGTTVGWLSYRPPARPLSEAEQRLIRDLASHLGGAVHARVLRNDLQSTRERLVLAREEERRRLRRDLHDGIGPALAGLTLKTETARALLPPGAERSSRELQLLREEIRHTVTDVRRVVEGLRPPAIDELGLVPACTQTVERLCADGGLAATLAAPDGVPPLPAAVEVAAYRIIVEAVTNTVRHANARRCHVTLSLASTTLLVSITDDGVGLTAAGRHGSGLAIMRERAQELGGTFDVTEASPGVTVQATLPFSPAPTNQRHPR